MIRVAKVFLKNKEVLDVDRIVEGNLQRAIEAVYAAGGSHQTIAFIAMIMLLPHFNEVAKMGTEISFVNPLQGLLFLYILENILCYGCEQQFFKLPDLGVLVDANGATTQCGRMKKAAIAKKDELIEYCKSRKLDIPDFENHFFQFHEVPYLIGGDRSDSAEEEPLENSEGDNEG